MFTEFICNFLDTRSLWALNALPENEKLRLCYGQVGGQRPESSEAIGFRTRGQRRYRLMRVYNDPDIENGSPYLIVRAGWANQLAGPNRLPLRDLY